MKRVVSVSLGSSKRDKSSTVNLLGEEFEVSRIGTNGDMNRFAELMKELDGNVDAIGLGGMDRYLWTDKKRYIVRDADRLAKLAIKTPVVDGSGVKNTLERKTIEYLQNNGIVNFPEKKVMLVSAVDRFGMAQTIAKLTNKTVFGDLMFALNLPIPMRSYSTVRMIAGIFLPLVARMPFQWLYPTGEKQNITVPQWGKYYEWADVVAGDYLYIKRTMPTVESNLLNDKTIITNTITEEDMQMLKDRKVKLLVTSTPEFDGRRFATNVFEGIMITLLGKSPDEITLEDYEMMLAKLDWKPTITYL